MWNYPLTEDESVLEEEFVKEKGHLPDLPQLLQYARGKQCTPIGACGSNVKIGKSLSGRYFICCDNDERRITSEAATYLEDAIEAWISNRTHVYEKVRQYD